MRLIQAKNSTLRIVYKRLMKEILALTIPFFGIIFLGVLARFFGFFDHSAGRILSKFAFFFVLPAFMFISIISTPFSDIINLTFILRYEAVTIIVFLMGLLLSSSLQLSSTERGIFALNTAYPNYGYIGIPLAILAFGEDAIAPMALIMICDNLLLMILTSFSARDTKNTGILTSLSQSFKSMGKNPLILSVLTGFIFSALEVNIPSAPMFFLDMLAGAAAPSALFALGITLVGQPIKGALLELNAIVVTKLLIHPMLMASIMLWGSDFDLVWIQTAILFSCLPIAANVFALSEFYNSYQGRTATSIMISTLFASVSVPATLYMITFLS